MQSLCLCHYIYKDSSTSSHFTKTPLSYSSAYWYCSSSLAPQFPNHYPFSLESTHSGAWWMCRYSLDHLPLLLSPSNYQSLSPIAEPSLSLPSTPSLLFSRSTSPGIQMIGVRQLLEEVFLLYPADERYLPGAGCWTSLFARFVVEGLLPCGRCCVLSVEFWISRILERPAVIRAMLY